MELGLDFSNYGYHNLLSMAEDDARAGERGPGVIEAERVDYRELARSAKSYFTRALGEVRLSAELGDCLLSGKLVSETDERQYVFTEYGVFVVNVGLPGALLEEQMESFVRSVKDGKARNVTGWSAMSVGDREYSVGKMELMGDHDVDLLAGDLAKMERMLKKAEEERELTSGRVTEIDARFRSAASSPA